MPKVPTVNEVYNRIAGKTRDDWRGEPEHQWYKKPHLRPPLSLGLATISQGQSRHPAPIEADTSPLMGT